MAVRATATSLIAIPLIASCSASSAPPPSSTSSTPSPTPPGLRLSGTVVTSEANSFNAPFQSPMQVLVNQTATAPPMTMSCMQYASGMNDSFVPPQIEINVMDHSLYVAAQVASGYNGPGSYSSASNPTLGGTVSVETDTGFGESGAFSFYRSRIGGASTVTVNPDGSGTFDFSEWGSDEVRGNTGSATSISGALTGRCH